MRVKNSKSGFIPNLFSAFKKGEAGFTPRLFPTSKKGGVGFTPHLFPTSKKGEGFTLIETVVYIALLAILIGGGMVGVFNILEGGGRTRQAMYREQEAYFITRKIDAVISEASTIDTSAPGVLVTDDVGIELDGEQIILERGGTPYALNDTLVPATALNFDFNSASSTITTTFTLDEHPYSVSNYYYED